MDDKQFTCPNPACPHYQQEGHGNINVAIRCYGVKKTRLMICNTCGKTFSELKGTAFWDSRLDWEKIAKIYQSLFEGNGIRLTARLLGLSKNTVKRYLRLTNEDPDTVKRFLEERGVLGPNNPGALQELLEKFFPQPVRASRSQPAVA